MTAKAKFQALVRCYEASVGGGRKTEIVESLRTPAWAPIPSRCSHTVTFRFTDMEDGCALLTGCGPSYESAYGQLLEFYMDKLGLSEEELELRAAVYGG